MLNGLPILNPFPDLLLLSSLAPFLLRVVLGAIAINSGMLKRGREKSQWIQSAKTAQVPDPELIVSTVGILEIILGVMFVFGFYTQIAGICYGIISFSCLYAEYKDAALVKRDLVFYILILTISISLVLSGAGSFSLDLPL